MVSLQADMVDTSVCYEKSNVRSFIMGESSLQGWRNPWTGRRVLVIHLRGGNTPSWGMGENLLL